MKRITFFLLTLLMFIPLSSVFAYSGEYSFLPDVISATDDVEFTRTGETEYTANVDSSVDFLDFKLDLGSSYLYDGSTHIVVDGTITSQKYRIYNNYEGLATCNEETCESIVITLIVNRPDKEESTALESLNVVGYKLNFKQGVYNYTVNVPSNLSEVYIDAQTVGHLSTVDGAGTIKINKNTTKVKIVVSSDNISSTTYNITIKKKFTGTVYVIIIALLVLLFIAYIVFKHKKENKKVTVSEITGTIDKKEINKDIIKPVNVVKLDPNSKIKIQENSIMNAINEETPAVPEVKEEVKVETPKEEVKETKKEEVKEEKKINNPLIGGGITPRTMIIPDVDKK